MNRQLRLVKGLNAFYFAGNAVLLPYLPLYFAAKGFSPVEIGLLMMIGPFIAVFAQPVWGYASDRLQTVKRIIALLWICAFASSVALFTVEGFATTLISVTLLYFFLMPTSPLLDSLSIRSAEVSGVSYGSIRMWGSVGFSSFAAISGLVLVWIGGIEQLKWVYWGIGVFPLTLLVWLRDVPANGPPVTLRALLQVARNWSFLWFLLLVFVMIMPHRMNDGFLGLHMLHLGATEQLVGLAWTVAALSEAPTFALLHRYLARFQELALLGIVGLLFALRWYLYSIATDPYLILFLQASQAVTFAVFWICAVSYAVRAVPPELRSTGQSLFAAVFVGVAGIASGWYGGLMEELGGYELAYGAGAWIAGVGGALFLATHEWQRRALRKRERLP